MRAWGNTILGAALLATPLSLSCRGAAVPGSKASPDEGRIAPPPRSVVVQEDRVVIEGRWSPTAAEPASPVAPNAVRVVCVRLERSCKEDLTRLAPDPGADPVHEMLSYRVEEWTKEGKPAGKLIASRREGTIEVEIRVSLSGFAAEKVAIDKKSETHWRLE